MTPPAPQCIRCGAELRPDQEYCLECGARQSEADAVRWRRPLIAAAVTLVLAALVLVLGYDQMRDSANSDAAAAHRAAAGSVRQAGASAGAAGSGNRRQARVMPSGAQPSP